RLPGLDLSTLITNQRLRTVLSELTDQSSEQDIMNALAFIDDQDVHSFLFEIINHLRRNDVPAAELRLRLRLGEASPVNDATSLTASVINSGDNSDQVLLPEDREELERALDPEHFQDWILWLHKDQRELAEADFDKPAVLTGVSGSGKT